MSACRSGRFGCGRAEIFGVDRARLEDGRDGLAAGRFKDGAGAVSLDAVDGGRDDLAVIACDLSLLDAKDNRTAFRTVEALRLSRCSFWHVRSSVYLFGQKRKRPRHERREKSGEKKLPRETRDR